MSIVIQVAIARGIHLFPFRTEKLSLVTPMVLRNSGRVGSCRFFLIQIVFEPCGIRFRRARFLFCVCVCLFFCVCGMGVSGKWVFESDMHMQEILFCLPPCHFSLPGNYNRSNRILFLPENNIKLAGRFMLEALWTGWLFCMVRPFRSLLPGNRVWQPGQSFFEAMAGIRRNLVGIQSTLDSLQG